MCLASAGEIVAIQEDSLLRPGQVLFGRIQNEVSLVFVPEAKVGDMVMVHAGIAIAMVRYDEGPFFPDEGKKQCIHEN